MPVPESPDFKQTPKCQHTGMSGPVTTGNPPTWRCGKCGEKVTGRMILPQKPLMPESPDFEQMAQRLVIDGWRSQDARLAIAEQLRLVWNARGAADIAIVKAEVSDMVGLKANQQHLDRALQKLDR